MEYLVRVLLALLVVVPLVRLEEPECCVQVRPCCGIDHEAPCCDPTFLVELNEVWKEGLLPPRPELSTSAALFWPAVRVWDVATPEMLPPPRRFELARAPPHLRTTVLLL